MKIRCPLYVKIPLFFALNLLFIGALFYAFFQLQFHAGLDSLLLAQASERVQAVGKVMAGELSETEVAHWDRVLQRFSQAYGTPFVIFQNDGTQMAGDTTRLPAEVLAKLKTLPGGGLGRRGPPPGRGPNRFLNATNIWTPPGRGLNRAAALSENAPLAAFLVQSRQPVSYWIGVSLPVLSNTSPGMLPVLLAQSDTLRGGLFPDLSPWLWVGLGALLCSALFWLPFVRGITKYIGQMTQATERIAEGQLDTRVPTRRNDELGRLGLAINRMSERLQGFVTGQRRFMGDVAHELCSPLARLQLATGTLETQATPAQQNSVADIQEDLRQMAALIHELLAFSKAALQPRHIKLQPVGVRALILEVTAREQIDARRLQIVADDSLQALADPGLLGRALANVVRNASRYGGQTGMIEITAEVDPDSRTLTLAVADSGPGVPTESLAQIFDPFYRVEPSRSRETGGTGLGLAIVKTCVEACQGSVTASNRKPNGLRVEIKLRPADATSA
jgi:two-component system, OmpR family, sensor histidine kinase CpxA